MKQGNQSHVLKSFSVVLNCVFNHTCKSFIDNSFKVQNLGKCNMDNNERISLIMAVDISLITKIKHIFSLF